MREIKFRAFYDNRMHDNCEAMRILYNNSTEHSLTPKYPIMQYTGLKDKNGTEIYEGDIVKCIDHPTGLENTIGEVHFEDGCFCVRYSMITLGGFREEWREVIGNIYQNAELLTKTQIQ